jgi:excisionase family DNA binding protein
MTKDLNLTAAIETPTSSDPPLLLTIPEAAAMLRVNERTWRTWLASGRIPQPIRIGRKVFWRPEDLKAWVAAGCPDRETWAVLQQ